MRMDSENPWGNPLVGATSNVDTQGVDTKIYALAEQLSVLHGEVRIAQESSGTHLYMASPVCLEDYGSAELSKKHLAVNADVYFGLGRYSGLATGGSGKINRRKKNKDNCGYCMKTGTAYRVSQLLKMSSLKDRGFEIGVSRAGRVFVQSASREDKLVDDGRGNMIPDHPGEAVPVTALPEDHVAVVYLRERGYTDLEKLYRQFRCSWCVKESEESRVKGRFWKNMPCGFKDTPQNRLIFYADMLGVQQGWQARILDRVRDGLRWYYHPYTNEWVPMEYQARNESGVLKWVPIPNVVAETERTNRSWNPSKYKTGPGVLRNKILMGLDGAIAWNREQGNDLNPKVILCEGPLDAGRFGPPAIPLLGKHFSMEQAYLIHRYFRHVTYVADNDEAGQSAQEKVKRMLAGKVDVRVRELPSYAADPGELKQKDADQWVREL